MAEPVSALLRVIVQQPLTERPKDKVRCPFCYSEDLRKGNVIRTCVGWTKPPDPNHCWTDYHCMSCKSAFVRETSSDNVWYTQSKNVLCGVPNCFEEYIYDCKNCGGTVRRKYRDLSGTSPVSVLRTEREGDKWVRKYRTFYVCDGCSQGVELDGDYWTPGQG